MSQMEIKKPVTIDDMYHMPRDGRKYELVDGEVVVSPAGMRHGEIGVKIATLSGHIWMTTRLERPLVVTRV
jgi:hypothetical protein